MIISKDDPQLSKCRRISGKLQIFSEQGSEGHASLVIYDDVGVDGPLNPSFDPSLPESPSSFKNFQSYDRIYVIRKFDMLEIDGIIYGLIPDIAFAKADNCSMSLYPRGFSARELYQLFSKNMRATVYILEK